MFTATTFAEAGEFDTARELARELRNILLVLQAEDPAPDVLSTALSMMDRLEAGVEILSGMPAEKVSPLLTRFLEDVAKKGKNSRMIHRPGIQWETVVGYASSVPDIVCILVESLEKWGLNSFPKRRHPPPWSNRLPCPLVVAAAG
ncbi:MAG: hypothetical protein HQL94_00665 [Magnetococcales bacterium]|nr:hypothetical protein [Magnetococcales bacterium]MBF0437807.1 hypothetical protein [Magnetococcales bacterium]